MEQPNYPDDCRLKNVFKNYFFIPPQRAFVALKKNPEVTETNVFKNIRV